MGFDTHLSCQKRSQRRDEERRGGCIQGAGIQDCKFWPLVSSAKRARRMVSWRSMGVADGLKKGVSRPLPVENLDMPVAWCYLRRKSSSDICMMYPSPTTASARMYGFKP